MLCSGSVGIFGSRGHPVPHRNPARFLSLGALMKLEPMSAYAFRNKHKVIREPLYTLPEIADKLGMEYKTIAGYMRGMREGKPKPAMKPTNWAIKERHNLYKLSEFKAWVKELGKSK